MPVLRSNIAAVQKHGSRSLDFQGEAINLEQYFRSFDFNYLFVLRKN